MSTPPPPQVSTPNAPNSPNLVSGLGPVIQDPPSPSPSMKRHKKRADSLSIRRQLDAMASTVRQLQAQIDLLRDQLD